MFGGGLSGVANGNILPCTFIKPDTTTIGRFLQCGAGDAVLGISQPGTDAFPYPGLDTNYAAVAGEQFMYWPLSSQFALLQLGGTVNVGDYIKSDSAGRGITTTSSGDKVGAYAFMIGGAQYSIIPVLMIGPLGHP